MNKTVLEGLAPSTNNICDGNELKWPTPDWASDRWNNIKRDYSLEDVNK